MNIGGTNYIPFYSPSSSAPIPSNAFLVMYHPHSSHGSSGWSATSRHVVPSFTSTFVLGGYIPPYVSRGQPFY